MKKVLVGALLAATATYGSAIEVGTGIWQQSMGGSLNDGAVTMNQLGLEGSNDLYFYATVDMPLFIPNLKIRSQSLTASGTGNVDASLLSGFAGMTLPAGAVDLSTKMDLSYLDVVAHYGLPLPVMDVDFGINLRMINGSIAIKSSTGPIDESGDLTLPIPMLHASVGMPLPANISVYGEYNMLPLDGVSVTDLLVKARYVLPVPTLIVDLGIEVGYHDFTISITKPTDMASDINSKGFFVGVSAEF
jgi:outer membrane protein